MGDSEILKDKRAKLLSDLIDKIKEQAGEIESLKSENAAFKLKFEKTARGILGATIIYAFLVLISRAF